MTALVHVQVRAVTPWTPAKATCGIHSGCKLGQTVSERYATCCRALCSHCLQHARATVHSGRGGAAAQGRRPRPERIRDLLARMPPPAPKPHTPSVRHPHSRLCPGDRSGRGPWQKLNVPFRGGR